MTHRIGTHCSPADLNNYITHRIGLDGSPTDFNNYITHRIGPYDSPADLNNYITHRIGPDGSVADLTLLTALGRMVVLQTSISSSRNFFCEGVSSQSKSYSEERPQNSFLPHFFTGGAVKNKNNVSTGKEITLPSTILYYCNMLLIT